MSIELNHSCANAARIIAEGVLNRLYSCDVGCTIKEIDPFRNTHWTFTDFVKNGTVLQVDGVPVTLIVQTAITHNGREVRVHLKAGHLLTYQAYGSDLWKDGNSSFANDVVANVISLFRRFHGYTDLPVVLGNTARLQQLAMYTRPSITVAPLRAAAAGAAAVLRGDGGAPGAAAPVVNGRALGGAAPPRVKPSVAAGHAAAKRLLSEYEAGNWAVADAPSKLAAADGAVPRKPLGKKNAAKKALFAKKANEPKRSVGMAEDGCGWVHTRNEESSSDGSFSSGERVLLDSESDPSSPGGA